jgi:hypothetical protein
MGRRLVENLRAFDVKTVRICGAVVIAIGVLVVLAVNGLSSDDSSGSAATSRTVVLTEAELLAEGGDLPHPAYWAGVRPGSRRYQLTMTSDGEIYLRYLPGKGGAGASDADLVTVGTYEVGDARQALRRAQSSEENLSLSRHPGFEVLAGDASFSAYVVFDTHPELQVEVYSPVSGEARDLVDSGAVKLLQ